MYGDPDHPDRVTRAVHSPTHTREDRALLGALSAYEASLCSGCSEPKHEAWHSDMDGGWYEPHGFVCFACTARQGREVAYGGVRNTRDMAKKPIVRPFELGVTTKAPEPPKKPNQPERR